MEATGKTDEDLQELLRLVSLEHILGRELEQGWNAVNDWQEVLSGGEKQRLGFARLMYHCPRFALLDESTSGVSPDIEVCVPSQNRRAPLFCKWCIWSRIPKHFICCDCPDAVLRNGVSGTSVRIFVASCPGPESMHAIQAVPQSHSPLPECS